MSPRRVVAGDRPDDGTPVAQPGTPPVGPVGPVAAVPDRTVDPRAVRIVLGRTAAHADVAQIVIEPPDVLLAGGVVVVDGGPTAVRLDLFGPVHGVLVEGSDEPTRTPVVLMPDDRSPGSQPSAAVAPRSSAGTVRREVVVNGWRIEVEIESERRASLRKRAKRGREATASGGPTEVRAIIPGQVVSVSVVPGDAVVAGQQLLVVEAMKMQNELRAPRDGVVSKVTVGADRTIEVGDLLLVLE